MKAPLFFIFTMFYAGTAHGFAVRTTSNGELVKWDSDQIEITLSPTLETLGPAEDVYFAVEDAFDIWIHEADINVDVQFFYGNCTPGYSPSGKNTNCIFVRSDATGKNEDAGGNASITYSQTTGEIFDGDIIFYRDAGDWKFEDDEEGLDFKHVVLHEIGHFWGLTHSSVGEAVMYPTVNLFSRNVGALHSDDIYGALALYDTSEIEGDASCHMAPAVRTDPFAQIGLLGLLLSVFFPGA